MSKRSKGQRDARQSDPNFGRSRVDLRKELEELEIVNGRLELEVTDLRQDLKNTRASERFLAARLSEALRQLEANAGAKESK